MSFTPFCCHRVLGSIVVSIPACHAGDRGSIPRRGDFFFSFRNFSRRFGVSYQEWKPFSVDLLLML